MIAGTAPPPPPTTATSRGGGGNGAPWVVTVTTAGVEVVVVRVMTRHLVMIRPCWPLMRVIAAPRGQPRAAVTMRRLTTRFATMRFFAVTCWRA
jgi:hypothetical protein